MTLTWALVYLGAGTAVYGFMRLLERRVNDMDVTVGLVSGAQDALMEDFYSKGRAIRQMLPAGMALLAALVALAVSVLQAM